MQSSLMHTYVSCLTDKLPSWLEVKLQWLCRPSPNYTIGILGDGLCLQLGCQGVLHIHDNKERDYFLWLRKKALIRSLWRELTVFPPRHPYFFIPVLFSVLLSPTPSASFHLKKQKYLTKLAEMSSDALLSSYRIIVITCLFVFFRFFWSFSWK